MKEEENKQEDTGAWLRVFCPEVRCLTEEEISNLPDEKKRTAEDLTETGTAVLGVTVTATP